MVCYVKAARNNIKKTELLVKLLIMIRWKIPQENNIMPNN